MTYKLFGRQGTPESAPSTQFAPTIVVDPAASDGTIDVPLSMPSNLDASMPDSSITDSVGSGSGMPDVVTDIGGLPSEVPDPSDSPTLSHIGRYALKRQLGAGGLGAVFEAWDPLLSRAVAVKTLQFDVDAQARVSLDGLFLNEARAAAGLNHKYIVTVHDAGLSAHGVYIAMERLYGRDLQQALADGWRPDVDHGVQLIRRVAEALAYAHARGVVHCDIKPANIFLQRRDKPKVLDFGIARIAHGSSLPALEGAVAGSPRYRAPEQLTGGAVDARTDLFSLGVVAYEVLTGRRAFGGESLADINRAVLDRTPAPAHEVNPAIDPELSAIVHKLLARAPADRYTCASEVVMELRGWAQAHGCLRSDTTRMPALVAPAKPTKAAPSGRTSRWLVAGALVMGAAAAGLTLMPGPRSPSTTTDRPGSTPAAVSPSAATLPTSTGPQQRVEQVAVLPAALQTGTQADPAFGTAVPPPSAVPTEGAAPAGRAGTASAMDPGPIVANSESAGTATGTPLARLEEAAAPTAPTTAATRSTGAGPEAGAGLAPPPQTLVDAVRASMHRQPRSASPPGDKPAADGPSTPSLRAAAAVAPAATGRIQLAITPWGQVEVDGKPMGVAPPLRRLVLPVGPHTVTVRNGDHPAHTVQVDVNAERGVAVRHRFGS